jgi:iron complex outermembrane receptor protein
MHTLLRSKTRSLVNGMALLLASGTAVAAEPEATATTKTDKQVLEEITVTASTGTLIRGVAPTGTNVIGLDSKDIAELAPLDTNDLLANVAQVTNMFNTAPTPGATIGLPFNRPNIRQLGASGGSTTLLLLNGHRMVSSGILQTSPDASVIAPGVLDRVEVVPDGGSSIYGSDAIGGVINFLTRREVEGVEVSAQQGFGDHYDSTDVNLTGGLQWEEGSAYLSYNYAEHDEVLGGDRSWVYSDHTRRGDTDYRVLFCNPGTISAGGKDYRMQDAAPGQNLCDETDVLSVYPKATDNRVFGAVEQALSDTLAFDMTGYFSDRKTVTSGMGAANGTGVRGMGTITAANPYFRPVAAETSQSVNFNYSDVFGNALDSTVKLGAWMLTPRVLWEFADDWRLSTSLNYGQSDNKVENEQISTQAQAAALAGTTPETALNPYDVSQTSPQVLDSIRDYLLYGKADQELFQLRSVADGSVYTLPTGDVKLAVGIEYMEEEIDASQGEGPTDALRLVSAGASRDVGSVFGEVIVPVLNGTVGLLDLSLSGRYDDYSDVGSTTNPKVGLSYHPIDELTIRGNWGTSFHAPSLADLGDAVDSRVTSLPISPLLAPGATPGDFLRPTWIIAGGNPDLKPEEADTVSFGFDWLPKSVMLDGLSVSATYFYVDFTDQLTLPPFLEPGFFENPSYQDFFIVNPTLEEVQEIAGGMRVENGTDVESLYATAPPYILFDARRANLGSVKVDGIDFDVHYLTPVREGMLFAGVAGSYALNRDEQAIDGAATENGLEFGVSRLQVITQLGWSQGPATLNLRVNHNSGFEATREVNVHSFTTTNLYAAYVFEGSGWRGDTTVSVNVDNMLDVEPPYYDSITGFANGSTLGRVLYLGIQQKF